MDDLNVPLSLIATEIGVTPDELAAKLDPNSVLINSVGLRCLEQSTAARLLDEHTARQAAERRRAAERRERHRANDPVPALRARVEAIRMQQQNIDVDGDLAKSAYATMTAGDHESRLNRAGRRWDELVRTERTGEMTYHSLSHLTQEE